LNASDKQVKTLVLFMRTSLLKRIGEWKLSSHLSKMTMFMTANVLFYYYYYY